MNTSVKAVESAFELFPWNEQLETGIPLIDEQHLQLVHLLNQLGQHYVRGVSEAELAQVLDALADYADYHFNSEEAIWAQAFGTDDWFQHHAESHQAFFAQVTRLREGKLPLSELLEELLAFLTQWLAYHILDSDKRMAKAVQALQDGLKLPDAQARADEEMRGATGTLIKTVLSMYEKLSSQAMQLMQEKHARHRAEEALNLSEQRWKFLLEGGQENLWEWSDSGASSAALLQQAEGAQGRIHADDLDWLRATLAELWQPDCDTLDITYRLVADNGEVRWMQLRGKVLARRANGEPLRIIGTRQDATERELVSQLIRLGHELVFITDQDNRFIAANPAFTSLTGFTLEQVLGKNPSALASGEHSHEYFQQMWQALQHSGFWEGDIWNCRPDGTRYALHLFIQRHDSAQGTPSYYVATGFDISDRKAYEAELRQERKRLQTTLDAVEAGTWEWDLHTDRLICNEYWSRMLGFAPQELEPVLRSTWENRVHRDDLPALINAFDTHLNGQSERLEVEYRMQSKNGQWLWLRSIGRVMQRDAQGQAERLIGLTLDITELKTHQQQLEFVELHDTLTGLPNRNLFMQLLKSEMVTARRDHRLLALVYLDVDGFAQINDEHGVQVGDRMIVALSQRIRDRVREHHNIARIGGDEFVLLLTALESAEDCHAPLMRLLETLSEPLQVDGLTLSTSTSMGVALYPQDQEVDADSLMRQAAQALYQAKQAGKNRFYLFDPETDALTRRTLEHIEEIRLAFADRQFVLHYQPKVNMVSGEVIGAEALIRWQHPVRGLLPPGLFMPLIEQHALSIELGEWVIDTVLQQLSTWNRAGLSPHFCISVNVGVVQLHDSEFASRVQQLLQRYPEVKPQQLELEILETGAIEDMQHVSTLIHRFQSTGIGCALDDFGTGYSSLTFLKNIPARTIKIDQSFVRDMLTDPEHLIIIQSIIGLAESLNRSVIAEGVEEALHGGLLLEMGCSLAQGYCIARPMPAADFLDWMQGWQPPQTWRQHRPLKRRHTPLLLAEVELRQWLQQLQQVLSQESQQPPIMEVENCRFTHWLQEASQLGADGKAELMAHHRRLHEEGRILLNLFAAGQDDLIQYHFRSLQMGSQQLIQRLRQLRMSAPDAP